MTQLNPFQHPSLRTGKEHEQFFDLSLADHAYIFGLLHADGCHQENSRNRGRIALELKVEDRPLLESLQALMPWYSSVRTRTRTTNFAESTTNAVWTLCSHDARTELSELGLPPGPKSRNAAPPKVAGLSVRDYLRGLIDGDGSLGFTAKGYPFVAFTTASERLIRFVEKQFERLTGVRRRTNRNARDQLFNVLYTNDPAKPLALALYENSRLAIARKREVAMAIRKWERPKSMRSRPVKAPRPWTEAEDRLAASSLPVAQVATRIGRTSNAVSTRRWRLGRGQTHDHRRGAT